MRHSLLIAALAVALALSQPPRAGEDMEEIPSTPLTNYLDIDQAAFLQQRAEAGDAAMQCLYGLALINGSAGRTDLEEGEKWLKMSAEAGDERGMFEYGRFLYLGFGRERDQAGSLKYFRPLAERGNIDAAYLLGAALLVGEGIEPDPVEGRKWLEIAANAGLVTAQSDMGIALYSGLGGLEQNYTEAMHWFRQAARQGHGDSSNKIGVMYRHGYGVDPDQEAAILWFTLGSSQGDMYAQYNLANSYMNGEWVARDYVQAARWFEQSARRGSPESQYYLGCFYAEGIGLEKDFGRAREWLSLASRNGNAAADELLEQLYEEDDGAAADVQPLAAGAAQLLRESAAGPTPGIEKGRTVVLTIEPVVEVIPAPDGQSYYLTIPGYPGLIFCGMEPGDRPAGLRLAPGMRLRGVSMGRSGLPGFIRLGECRVVVEEEEAVEE